MSKSHILTAEADGVATITLNRPDAMNAFATGMRELVVGQAQAGRWRLVPSADDAWYADVALPADGDTAVAVGQSGRIIRIGR